MCIDMHIFLDTRIQICFGVYVYIHICIYVYLHIYIYIYIYIHVEIYTPTGGASCRPPGPLEPAEQLRSAERWCGILETARKDAAWPAGGRGPWPGHGRKSEMRHEV